MIENFERKGKWWLPTKPEEGVYGTLHFDPLEGVTVDLIGRLPTDDGSDSFPWQAEIVLGQGTNGEPMTLLSCHESNANYSGHAFYSDGFATSTLSASVLFVGQHFPTRDDIKFSELTLGFSHAGNWADVAQVTPEQGEHKLSFTYEIPESLEVHLAGGLTLSLDYGVSAHNGFDGASMTKYVNWHVEAAAEKSFAEWWKIQYLLQAFLTLATRQAVQTTNVAQMQEVAVELPDGQIGKSYHKTELFWDVLESTDERKTQSGQGMLFVLRDLGQDEELRARLETCLCNWFDKAERSEAVCELYIGTVHHKHIYPIHRFSNLIQALESYHRGATGQEVALRSRLHDLTQTYELVTGRTFARRSDFITKVVDTRNYLTHYDPRKKTRAARDQELYDLSQSLQRLLEMSLLRELGLEDQRIGHILTRDRRQRGWLEQS